MLARARTPYGGGVTGDGCEPIGDLGERR